MNLHKETRIVLNLWQFIESPPSDIFTEMARDRELFEEFVQNPSSLPTLRIFCVKGPAITVGRSWRSSFHRGYPVPLIRRAPAVCVRPTGGGLVRHGNDLIYSIMARRDSFPTFHQVRTSYLSFHEAIQIALHNLGIETHLLRCDEVRPHGDGSAVTDCFLQPVATDVMIGDRKVAGGGQWRRGNCFLHQGSIQLANGVSYEQLKEALSDAFQEKFKIIWPIRPARLESRYGRNAENAQGN